MTMRHSNGRRAKQRAAEPDLPKLRSSRMDMDDDDFMGEIEFDLSLEQKQIVERAISLAANSDDEFRRMNPLISIMLWWELNVAESEKRRGNAEATLAEACRQFVLVHERSR
jgi:hypothetical protein